MLRQMHKMFDRKVDIKIEGVYIYSEMDFMNEFMSSDKNNWTEYLSTMVKCQCDRFGLSICMQYFFHRSFFAFFIKSIMLDCYQRPELWTRICGYHCNLRVFIRSVTVVGDLKVPILAGMSSWMCDLQ